MRGFTRHERRWASDTVPGGRIASESSSPATELASPAPEEEFVEVTLDLQDDDTIILRSVEPATLTARIPDEEAGLESSVPETPSRSPTVRRSSSNRLLQFSQELKAEAVAKARHFSAELRRFSWSRQGSRASSSSMNVLGGGSNDGIDSALAARAMRRQRAQLDRTRSGAQKALRGLKFISTRKCSEIEAWEEIQANFNKLSKDGYLSRSDFAQCIGKNMLVFSKYYICVTVL